MAEVPLQSRPGGELTRPEAAASDGAEHQELGRLFREATRLLDATDLGGANETLKTAEQVLILRRRTFDLGHCW